MSKYKLMVYTPDLWKQVCRHQKELWGASIRSNADYLQWKYFNNPYLEEPLMYVALHDNQVVGLHAMFGTCWEAGDYSKKQMLPNSADLGIAPDHRDGGLFKEFADYVSEDLHARGHNHVLTLSPTASNYVVAVMTLGWRPMGTAEEMVMGGGGGAPQPAAGPASGDAPRQSPLKAMVKQGKQAGIDLAKKAKTAMRITAYAALDKNTAGGKGPLIVSKTPRPEVMAALVDKIGGDGRLRHVRDEAFFSWRFNNPRYCYRFLLWGEKNPSGYMVLQTTVGRRQVNIVDWEGENPQVRSEMLETALKLGEFRTMTTWGTALSESSREALQTAGFSAPGGGRHSGGFMMKLLSSDPEDAKILGSDPLDKNSWDLRMIYSDGQ